MKKNLNIIILGLAALSLSSCKTLYGKYERPDVKTSGIVRDVASDTDTLAVKDTTTFANIPWRSVFTDPQLQSIIEKANKASIVFSLSHDKGSLSKVLTILSFYDVNLTKIQSLPVIGHEWEYLFYVDLTFDNLTRYRQSIDAITPLVKKIKVLGEYEERE